MSNDLRTIGLSDYWAFGLSVGHRNDLPGDKIEMKLIVPSVFSQEDTELENAAVFPACAKTRVMRTKLKEEETLLQDGNTETSDVEIKDAFCVDVNDESLYGDMFRYSTDMDQIPLLCSRSVTAQEAYKVHVYYSLKGDVMF